LTRFLEVLDNARKCGIRRLKNTRFARQSAVTGVKLKRASSCRRQIEIVCPYNYDMMTFSLGRNKKGRIGTLGVIIIIVIVLVVLAFFGIFGLHL